MTTLDISLHFIRQEFSFSVERLKSFIQQKDMERKIEHCHEERWERICQLIVRLEINKRTHGNDTLTKVHRLDLCRYPNQRPKR